MANENCYSTPEDLPLRTRIGHRLFPAKYVSVPEPDDKVKGHGDVIVTTVMHEVSFIDRLKLLVTGVIAVEVKTATENRVGYTKTNAEGYVLAPKWMLAARSGERK